MQYTSHYNLNLPEGADIVNPLVQDNPNYTAIDNALYANKLRVIGGASEVKTGTNHAITRSDTDIDVIRFTATSDWTAGDTMTIDGTTVSVFAPDGEALQNGAYVINSEVFAILNGSRLTLFTNKADIDRGSVSVTGDGVKTYGDLLSELFALVDMSKITPHTVVNEHTAASDIYYYIESRSASAIICVNESTSSSRETVTQLVIRTNGAATKTETIFADGSTTQTVITANVIPNGELITLYY